MIRVAICDDVAQDRALARGYTEAWARQRGLTCDLIEYERGEALLADYQDGEAGCSLLLLDICLPGLSGIETARRIRALDQNVPIVFITACAGYAVESYEVEAAGYQMKPLQQPGFVRLLEKLLGQKAQRRLALKISGAYRYFDHSEIRYIESTGRHAILHLNNDEPVTVNQKLADLEARLDDRRFLRCHQSFLVNMDYIRKVERDFILRDGSIIQIRSRRRKDLLEHYYNYYLKRGRGER